MIYDFKFDGYIYIRKNQSSWGPYSFDISNYLQEGSTIVQAQVYALVGNIDANTYTGTEEDISNKVIHGGSTAVSISNNILSISFDYLVDDLDAYRDKPITLRFVIHNTSGYYPIYFPYVRIV